MHCLPPSTIVSPQAPIGNSAAGAGHVDLANGFRFAVDSDRWVDDIILVTHKGDKFRVYYTGLTTNHGFATIGQNANDERQIMMTIGFPLKSPPPPHTLRGLRYREQRRASTTWRRRTSPYAALAIPSLASCGIFATSTRASSVMAT